MPCWQNLRLLSYGFRIYYGKHKFCTISSIWYEHKRVFELHGLNCILYYPQFRAVLNFRVPRKKNAFRAVLIFAHLLKSIQCEESLYKDVPKQLFWNSLYKDVPKQLFWNSLYKDVPKQLVWNSFSPINHSGHLLRKCDEGWAAGLRETHTNLEPCIYCLSCLQ